MWKKLQEKSHIDRSENWIQPKDWWRSVTNKTVHNYLPLEGGDVTIHKAFRHVMDELSSYRKAPKTLDKALSGYTNLLYEEK